MMVGEPSWTLENDRHCAEARVRAIAGIGQELRFSIDGELYYSHGDTAWGELDRGAGDPMRTIGVFVVAVVFLAASPAAQTVTVTDASPPEARLAALDAHSKTVQQSAIGEYAHLLDGLDRKCKEDRDRIGDVAVKGVQLLAEKKVAMTHKKFLQAMNDSMPKGSEALNLGCAEIAAFLVTMIDRQ